MNRICMINVFEDYDISFVLDVKIFFVKVKEFIYLMKEMRFVFLSI